jgi:quercetin dioxygenase-like cupin family protein
MIMTASPNASELIEIKSGHNVKKVGRQHGASVQVGPVGFRWKVRGADTGFQFAVYEMDLEPGLGIPLHKHPYAEFFYVLDGVAEFCRLAVDGLQEWVSCTAGESVLAPVNIPHGFRNRSEHVVRYLSLSTYYHEALFNEFVAGAPAGSDPTAPDVDQMAGFMMLTAKCQGYNVQAGDSGRVLET